MTYVKKTMTEDDRNNLRISLFMNRVKLSPEPVCDFCGDEPLFIYGAKRMSTGEAKRCWRWCSCELCSYLVDAERWDDLAQRIADMLGSLMPVSAPNTVLLESAKMALAIFKKEALED